MSEILNSPIFWIVVIVLVLIIFIYNNLNASKHRVEKSFSDIDIALSKNEKVVRALVENELIFTNAQGDLQKDVTELRSLVGKSKSGNINDRVNLDNSFRNFLATYENYPEFRGIDLFKDTNIEIVKNGENIFASRRVYNTNATRFNIKITSFPTNIFAKIFGFREKFQLFELNAKEREEYENGTSWQTGAIEAMRKRNENR